MSNEVKSKNTQKKNMIELAFIDAKIKAIVKEGEKILEEMTNGNSIKESAIYQESMTISLGSHKIVDGKRIDIKTGKEFGAIKQPGMVISKNIKGNDETEQELN